MIARLFQSSKDILSKSMVLANPTARGFTSKSAGGPPSKLPTRHLHIE